MIAAENLFNFEEISTKSYALLLGVFLKTGVRLDCSATGGRKPVRVLSPRVLRVEHIITSTIEYCVFGGFRKPWNSNFRSPVAPFSPVPGSVKSARNNSERPVNLNGGLGPPGPIHAVPLPRGSWSAILKLCQE